LDLPTTPGKHLGQLWAQPWTLLDFVTDDRVALSDFLLNSAMLPLWQRVLANAMSAQIVVPVGHGGDGRLTVAARRRIAELLCEAAPVLATVDAEAVVVETDAGYATDGRQSPAVRRWRWLGERAADLIDAGLASVTPAARWAGR
jgi:hypothetical protein